MLSCLATIGTGLLLILALLFLGRLSPVTQELIPPAISEQSAEEAVTAGETELDTHYAGITRGETSEGYPRLGEPDAPIVIEYYSSFGCSHCKRMFEEQFIPNLEHARAGEVQFIMKPITFISNENNYAFDSAKAALCAGQQDQFWEMHDLMFAWQGSGATVTKARLEAVINEFDLDVERFFDCFEGSDVLPLLLLSEEEFRDRDYLGVPSVLIDGVEYSYPSITSAIDDALQHQE